LHQACTGRLRFVVSSWRGSIPEDVGVERANGKKLADAIVNGEPLMQRARDQIRRRGVPARNRRNDGRRGLRRAVSSDPRGREGK
jgi:hypothetical protein